MHSRRNNRTFAVISIFLTRKRQNTLPEQDPGAQPKVTKLKPGRERKDLKYNYGVEARKRRGGSPSKRLPQSQVFSKATPFSELRFDTDQYKSATDYVDAQSGQADGFFSRQRGSESEDALKERQEAIERAAGKIRLEPILDAAPKVCNICGEPIPGSQKRFVILRVELPDCGIAVSGIERLAVSCEKCCDSSPKRAVEAQKQDYSWTANLTANERRAVQLRDQGFSQEEIGRQMGKLQETVSRLLKSAEGKRRAALERKLRETGGA